LQQIWNESESLVREECGLPENKPIKAEIILDEHKKKE
jgi:hypothetical protein